MRIVLQLLNTLPTALTAGIGLVPLVIGGQEPGREILYPVATVILGGLVTSTGCEFLIHPGLFWKFSGRDASRLAGETADAASRYAGTHDSLAVVREFAGTISGEVEGTPFAGDFEEHAHEHP